MRLHHKVMWTRSLMPGLDKHPEQQPKKKTSGILLRLKVTFLKRLLYFPTLHRQMYIINVCFLIVQYC